MAIYKPSNCAPFMETWDLDKPQVITCELNTNNIPVTGYKLKILDSKNETVYEDAEFKQLPAGYTGLNESELKIPFEPYDEGKNTAGFKTDKYGPLLRNNYPYQPYKWQITLAQGQITDGGFNQLPTNNDAYDMTVVSGTIIGSTKDRIQSKLSEEIYADYFIQLYKDDKKTTVGERALIESYDHTYGYLYPQKGEFTDEQIGNASYFQIFKNTNNIEYIKTNRIVDEITAYKMTEGWQKDPKNGKVFNGVDGGSYSIKDFTESSQTSNYYYTQSVKKLIGGVYVDEYEEVKNFTVPLSIYCGISEGGVPLVKGNFVAGETLLLVKDQNDGEGESEIALSKDNGVFLFVSAKWVAKKDGGTLGQVIITWQRPAMADTWAEFLGQSFFVKRTGENWDSTATASGTLGSTKLGFKPEEAIKIYPTGTTEDAQTFGEIFKTGDGNETDGYKVYVRPFVGLESGMRFSCLKGTTSHVYNDVKIDTDDWFVLVNKDLGGNAYPNFTPDVDTYSFTSFFKTSDENPFYAYTSATLKIEDFDTEDSGEYVHNSRILNVSAIYGPGEGVKASWSSYKWTLEDLLYGTIKETETQYSGTISAKFVGLENEHVYLLSVTVQDTLGRIQTAQAVITIQVALPPTFKDLKADFICNDAAVEIDMSVTGVVLPSSADAAYIDYLVKEDNGGLVPFVTADADKKTYLVTNASSDHITYSATGVTIAYGDETVKRDSLLEYNRMRFSGNLTGTLYGPSENTYVLASKHSGLSPYFEGPMIRAEHEIGVYRGVDSKTICEVGLEPDTVSWKEGLTKANDKRGQLYAEMAIYRQNGSKYVKGKEVIRSTGVTWRDTKPVVYAMREDKGKDENGKEINPPSDNYDYIDCDAVYEKATDGTTVTSKIKEGYKNIRGAGSYNSSANPDSFGMGFCLATGTAATGSFGFWSDKKLTQVTQADNSTICVESIEDEWNYWPENETQYYWCDESDYGVYQQVDVNATGNHSGRQELDGKKFPIQATFQNFDPTEAGVTDERKVELSVEGYNPATTGTTGGNS